MSDRSSDDDYSADSSSAPTTIAPSSVSLPSFQETFCDVPEPSRCAMGPVAGRLTGPPRAESMERMIETFEDFMPNRRALAIEPEADQGQPPQLLRQVQEMQPVPGIVQARPTTPSFDHHTDDQAFNSRVCNPQRFSRLAVDRRSSTMTGPNEPTPNRRPPASIHGDRPIVRNSAAVHEAARARPYANPSMGIPTISALGMNPPVQNGSIQTLLMLCATPGPADARQLREPIFPHCISRLTFEHVVEICRLRLRGTRNTPDIAEALSKMPQAGRPANDFLLRELPSRAFISEVENVVSWMRICGAVATDIQETFSVTFARLVPQPYG